MINETHDLPIGLTTFQPDDSSFKGGYETTLKGFNQLLEQELLGFMKFNYNILSTDEKKTKTKTKYSNIKHNKTQKN